MTAAEARAQADMTISAETDHDQGPITLPVVPPDRLPEFRREWRRRPYLRAVIHAAARAGRERCRRSKTAMALWELSQSAEWRDDDWPDGAIAPFPFAADFHALLDQEVPTPAWAVPPNISARAALAHRRQRAQARAERRRQHQQDVADREARDAAELAQKRSLREHRGAWDIRFLTMFSMSEDSYRFRTAAELEAMGYRRDGNIYRAPTAPEPERSS